MKTSPAHQVTVTLMPAPACELSGYPQITRTRRWVEYRVRCTYTDGESPIETDIKKIDALAPGSRDAAIKYAQLVREVVPHLASVKLSRVHRVEVSIEIADDFREDYDQRLGAGEFDHMVVMSEVRQAANAA